MKTLLSKDKLNPGPANYQNILSNYCDLKRIVLPWELTNRQMEHKALKSRPENKYYMIQEALQNDGEGCYSINDLRITGK